MADERDPLVSRRYRELGSEEPPVELDERILARSRRRRSFQWHGPVAAAAVIVLAVAVTVHLEREERTPESYPAPATSETQPAVKEDARVQERLYAPDPPVAQKAEPPAREEARSRRDVVRKESAPQAPAPAVQEPPAQPALEAQRAPEAGAAADSAPKPMAAPGSRLGKLAEQSPQQWLEGIAELRAQGRHEEADESLKRFRERYPGYQISEEMLAKIQKK
jgi:hypothetical protein